MKGKRRGRDEGRKREENNISTFELLLNQFIREEGENTNNSECMLNINNNPFISFHPFSTSVFEQNSEPQEDGSIPVNFPPTILHLPSNAIELASPFLFTCRASFR